MSEQDPDAPTEKACSKCGEVKSLEQFYKNKNGKFGRKSICGSCCADYQRKMREDEPLRAKSYGARWRANNREYTIEKSRADYEANPAAAKARWHKRRALLKGADGTHSAEDVERINAAQCFECVYCGASTATKKSVDHIIPLSRGGSNWPDNIQILCPRCNRAKWDRTDEEFRFLLKNGLTAVNDNKLKRDEVA